MRISVLIALSLHYNFTIVLAFSHLYKDLIKVRYEQYVDSRTCCKVISVDLLMSLSFVYKTRAIAKPKQLTYIYLSVEEKNKVNF